MKDYLYMVFLLFFSWAILQDTPASSASSIIALRNTAGAIQIPGRQKVALPELQHECSAQEYLPTAVEQVRADYLWLPHTDTCQKLSLSTESRWSGKADLLKQPCDKRRPAAVHNYYILST